MPARSANHGPSTIFYYGDPDDNQLELSASNYLTEPEVRAFLQVKPSAETLLGLMSIQPNTSGDIARAYHSKSCDGFQSLRTGTAQWLAQTSG